MAARHVARWWGVGLTCEAWIRCKQEQSKNGLSTQRGGSEYLRGLPGHAENPSPYPALHHDPHGWIFLLSFISKV